MNAKRKGKNGELEVAHILQSYGYNARRGVQYQGGADSPDVVGIDGYHIEVKRYKDTLNIYKAMEQSVRDCGNDIPIVISRKDRKEWLVTFRQGDSPYKPDKTIVTDRLNLYGELTEVLSHSRKNGEPLITTKLDKWLTERNKND